MISSQERKKLQTNRVLIEKDVPFLGRGRKEKMDLYLPAERGTNGFPAVLQIHGGGWSRGDKATPREQNIGSNLARAGFVCASINYQLAANEGRFPDRLAQIWPGALHDCMTGVRFLRANSNKYGIDPERIAALGTSAGGHLASMLGVMKEGSEFDDFDGFYREYSRKVQAVVSLYGVHDFLAFSETRDLNLSKGEFELCRQASPVTHLCKEAPPFLILHGSHDSVVPTSQSHALEAAASENGVESELHIIGGAKHSFHFTPPQKDLRPLAINFLSRHLK